MTVGAQRRPWVLLKRREIQNHPAQGHDVLVGESSSALLGGLGMLALAISWLRRRQGSLRLAQIGWIFVGFSFFTQAWKYYDHDDLVLTVMCTLTLPLACWAAWF